MRRHINLYINKLLSYVFVFSINKTERKRENVSLRQEVVKQPNDS